MANTNFIAKNMKYILVAKENTLYNFIAKKIKYVFVAKPVKEKN